MASHVAVAKVALTCVALGLLLGAVIPVGSLYYSSLDGETITFGVWRAKICQEPEGCQTVDTLQQGECSTVVHFIKALRGSFIAAVCVLGVSIALSVACWKLQVPSLKRAMLAVDVLCCLLLAGFVSVIVALYETKTCGNPSIHDQTAELYYGFYLSVVATCVAVAFTALIPCTGCCGQQNQQSAGDFALLTKSTEIQA